MSFVFKAQRHGGAHHAAGHAVALLALRIPRPRGGSPPKAIATGEVDLRDPIRRGAPPPSSRSARRRSWTWPADRVSAAMRLDRVGPSVLGVMGEELLEEDMRLEGGTLGLSALEPRSKPSLRDQALRN